jgi:hypothetical protein
MDIIEYTDNEIRKNLALLEIHLKQAPFSDKLFCEECINKHILILEGFAEEGLTVCIDCDTKKYEILLKFLNQIKAEDFQKQGIELAKQTRRLRKNFVPCDGENVGMKDRDDIKEKINKLIEDLHAAEDEKSQDRINYGIYLLNWVLRGKKCSDG